MIHNNNKNAPTAIPTYSIVVNDCNLSKNVLFAVTIVDGRYVDVVDVDVDDDATCVDDVPVLDIDVDVDVDTCGVDDVDTCGVEDVALNAK